jgi:N-acetylneuraminic acid mutarotase
VLQYNTITDEWKAVGTIPFPVPATTTAVLWDNEVVIPSGEIRAGVRTPNILVGKIRKD